MTYVLLASPIYQSQLLFPKCITLFIMQTVPLDISYFLFLVCHCYQRYLKSPLLDSIADYNIPSTGFSIHTVGISYEIYWIYFSKMPLTFIFASCLFRQRERAKSFSSYYKTECQKQVSFHSVCHWRLVCV